MPGSTAPSCSRSSSASSITPATRARRPSTSRPGFGASRFEAQTIRKARRHRSAPLRGILAAIRLGLSNGDLSGSTRKVP
jgi:hypothetical protein